MARYDLTEFEWRTIQPLLPNKPRGVPRVDDRRVLNGIFWVLRSGSPWADVPERYGPPTTIYNRFNRWRKAGIWDRLMGTKLKAIFSSDIGHWDVEDIGEVLEEAYELVEHKHIDESDFRAFTFTNIAELHGSLNRDFFKGTAVEDAVTALQRPDFASKAQAAE